MTARKWGSHQDANGLKLINLGAPTPASTNAARIIDVETSYAAAISRVNHVGTQLANTISDFDTAVRLNKVTDLLTPTSAFSMGNQKITNLADPGAAQDAATMGWVQAQVAGLATGQTLKGAVRVAATTDVNLASPGANIDAIPIQAGDIVLLTGQATGTQNGPYLFTSGATPLTRAPNWDSAAEAVVGSYWVVGMGTHADQFALLTNDSFTLGTTPGLFSFIGVSAAGVVAVQADLGNGALTSFTVLHNLGTRNVHVVVYRNTSPWDEVDVYVRRPDDNNIVIEPDLVFSTNEFHAVVSKM